MVDIMPLMPLWSTGSDKLRYLCSADCEDSQLPGRGIGCHHSQINLIYFITTFSTLISPEAFTMRMMLTPWQGA